MRCCDVCVAQYTVIEHLHLATQQDMLCCLIHINQSLQVVVNKQYCTVCAVV
jgi:hypothetical protein